MKNLPNIVKLFSLRIAVSIGLLMVCFSVCSGTAYAAEWVSSWYAAPQETWGEDFVLPSKLPGDLAGRTVRQRVRVSLGGQAISFIFSNEEGEKPVTIDKISVALASAKDGQTRIFTPLTFSGQEKIIIPGGEKRVSDSLEMTVASLAEIDVDMYFRDHPLLQGFHWEGLETALIGAGDQAGANAFKPESTTTARLFLSGVRVLNKDNNGVIVAIGDSITDGNATTQDTYSRWTDFLAQESAKHNIAIVNAGISGGRLLDDGMGVSALKRLDRDVFAQAGVTRVIVLLGINDISYPQTPFLPDGSAMTLDRLQQGFEQLIQRAHQQGLTVTGATLPPFKNALPGTPMEKTYYTAAKDKLRQDLNAWIRTSGVFDDVVDFDRILQDPNDPLSINPAYDSGDRLHPGDAGTRAMAGAISVSVIHKD